VMPEIGVSRGGNVDGGQQGDGDSDEKIERWGGGLVACCYYRVFCAREERVGLHFDGLAFAVWVGTRIETVAFAGVAIHAGWESGEVGGLVGVGAGCKERDCDGELGGQEQAEVDEAGCGE